MYNNQPWLNEKPISTGPEAKLKAILLLAKWLLQQCMSINLAIICYTGPSNQL